VKLTNTDPSPIVDDLEARLRTTYAHVTQTIPDDLGAPDAPLLRRTSRRGRRAAVAVLATVLGAGGLAVRALQPSNALVFTTANLTEPMVMPVDPPGFLLGRAARYEIPKDDGVATVYKKSKIRYTLKAGGLSFADERWATISVEGTTRVVDIAPGPPMVEIDDPVCRTIRLSANISRSELIALVPKLKCGLYEGRLRAELADESASAISYWGMETSSSPYILFSYLRSDDKANFSFMARRCACDGTVFDDAPASSSEIVRNINGTTVHLAGTTVFDNSRSPLKRQTVWWQISDDIAAQMIVPEAWSWDDVEPIVRSVRTVSLATWTDTLKQFGIVPQP
jgi:hypothetical protein